MKKVIVFISLFIFSVLSSGCNKKEEETEFFKITHITSLDIIAVYNKLTKQMTCYTYYRVKSTVVPCPGQLSKQE